MMPMPPTHPRARLRIALYHSWLHSRGGGEQVILELLKRSRHSITVFTHHYNPKSTYPALADADLQVLARTRMPKGELSRGARFALRAATTKLPLKGFDALVVSTGGIAELILLRNHQKPAIAYVHTPLRAVHDPAIIAHTRAQRSALANALHSTAAATYKTVERRAWRHVRLALCNSETTRQRLLAARLVPPGRTRVLHPGADLAKFRSGPSKKYFLYPSRFSYYKRQDLAIRAFLRYKAAHPESPFRLVLAGGVNPEKRQYFDQLRALCAGRKDILLRPDCAGRAWQHLYRNAHAIVFTAMNEDWGIVPLEAAACAKPVISVNEGGPRESIVHNRTGLLVPATEAALAAAMQRLAENPALAKRLGRAAQRRVRRYSWPLFAAAFDAAVEEAVHAR